ncbi:hypothetical protein PR003_g22064 [Phytophthora rubi]|uniref:Uncharacterized protein n=1 Tax=Phytophthora rubi TaxID=129364 RepID=A0A6A4D8S8_9STRA|nr:hypothetical protein PR003_g22064 [Phytophthora rubi]
MFNPAYFSKHDIESLRGLCERPAAAISGRRLREGTTEEWRIISGIAEGTVVCRRQPDFLKSILDSKECIRLYRTIQRQVEGELQLKLRGQARVHPARQDTHALQEDILAAGEALHMNTVELGRMLHLTKTISYNHVQRSIHLFFFDRATARKYQLLAIPYNRTIYHLVNVHAPDTGSVSARQLGRDGTRPMPQREYEVHIRNVTRFTDVGRLTAYLQKNIVAAIELEDMDTCTPNSRTSTVWRLIVKTAECPDFLRGIVRIMWYGRPLVLQHPDARQRLQCLRCGNMGHTVARCRYTDSQLTGPGGRVATEQEVARLEDLAKPFGSLEEVKQTAAKRLALQEAADRKAQEAIQPRQTAPETMPSNEGGASTRPSSCASAPVAAASGGQVVNPEPKKPWIA